MSYGVPVGGVTFPSELKSAYRSKLADGLPNHDTTVRLRSIKLTTMKPADFRLTAFGLPEPVDVPTPPPSRWYLWVLLVAGVSAALAVAIRWQLRTGNARRQERLDVK
ncbi:MAG: DUF4381 domain-containing protein [Planctomycetes bacterium]|nr:DUF4381 domain-containing protein [Planctomycetota bacterium]